MTEEELLQSLARLARQTDPLGDPRLDALGAGTISPADRAALEAEAAESPALREALEAFRPLDAEARARITRQLTTKKSPSVFGSRRRRIAAACAGALALAAGFLILLRAPSNARLSNYGEVETTGGEHDYLGGGTARPKTLRIGRGSHVEFTLRPDEAVHGSLDWRGFIRAADSAALMPWAPRGDISRGGVIHINGTRETLFAGVPDGTWELVLAIGRRGALPDDPAAVARALAAGDDARGFQIRRTTVELMPVKEKP